MSTNEVIEREFREKVCSEIRLHPEGIGRFRVFTPFLYDDGDNLSIVLKRSPSGTWLLSDEGHTFMRLTYDLDEKDLQRGTRQKIIANSLAYFNVQDRDGEFLVEVPDQQFGDALYSFVQALIHISDVSYLSRERVRSTFLEDFRAFLTRVIPRERLAFNWHDPKLDSQGKYQVDCRIEASPTPLFTYALASDDQVRDATIALLQFEKWGLEFRCLGIFEDQEQIGRKVLSRFTDVCERQFSNLSSNTDRIEGYLRKAVNA